MNFDVCNSLVWKIQRPITLVHKSPEFFFQGCLCVLTFGFESGKDGNYYCLRIKSEVASFKLNCITYTYLEGMFAKVLPSDTATNNCLWRRTQNELLSYFPTNNWNVEMRFFIIFENHDAGIRLSLKSAKDEATQAGECIEQNVKSVKAKLFLDDPLCLGSLSEDLSKLLDGGSSTHDVKLKCGDQTFGGHKIVLSARSQVFAKMLQSDMAEGRTGLVEIKDMDSGICEHFLRYLYTGTLPELTIDSAMSFYKAGDQYAVAGLMRRCSNFLIENLTPDSACQLLELADAHSDSQFKESVISYILDKKIPLLGDKWQVFCSGHPIIANEVLNRFCKLQAKMINAK